MKEPSISLQEAGIRQSCKALRLPTLGSEFGRMAEEAARNKQSHLGYLEALLDAEVDERERRTIQRRITATG